MFEQAVKIKKAAIEDVCTGGAQLLVKGEYELDGVTYPSGALVFCGFKGNKVAPGVWGGVYCFDIVGHQIPDGSITPERLQTSLASATSKPAAANRKRRKK